MRFGLASKLAIVFLAGIGFLCTPEYCPPSAGAKTEIDAREYARLVSSLSEPEGYFDSDNFISNEAGYLKILPLFNHLSIHGGVYLGVGPDQNYSYLAEVQPQLAFMVDIRRQNLLQHLYYKALFELSPNRVEFLQRLFGRRIDVPDSKATGWTIGRLVEGIEKAPRDANLETRYVREAEQVVHGWPLQLSDEDFRTIDYVARSLIEGGPELQFTSYNRRPRYWYPTYRELLLQTDSAGRNTNYLASDERFDVIRTLHRENRIIPVVADLAGSSAILKIARELRARRLMVSCFYLSNVEFYLFGSARWSAYVRNMQGLPWMPNAVLVRSFSNNWRAHPASTPGYYMTTVLQRASDFFGNEETGRNATYWDLVTNDYIGPDKERINP